MHQINQRTKKQYIWSKMHKITIQVPTDKLYEAVKHIRKVDFIHLLKEKTKSKLTPVEIGILAYILKGLTSIEIGKKLKISQRTVEEVKSNIFKKARVRNTIQLFKYALHNKCLSSSELFGRIKSKKSRSPLSLNETKVLFLIIKGLSSKEIAAKLKRSPKTIQTYRERIFKKTKTANRVVLVAYAYKNRLISV